MQALEGFVRADWMKRELCSRRTFKEMNRTLGALLHKELADSTQLNYICHIPAMSNPLLRREKKRLERRGGKQRTDRR